MGHLHSVLFAGNSWLPGGLWEAQRGEEGWVGRLSALLGFLCSVQNVLSLKVTLSSLHDSVNVLLRRTPRERKHGPPILSTLTFLRGKAGVISLKRFFLRPPQQSVWFIKLH